MMVLFTLVLCNILTVASEKTEMDKQQAAYTSDIVIAHDNYQETSGIVKG